MKIGRNEPCPCGSGKKYKKCCINKDISKIIFAGELPMYKVLITDSRGSRDIVVARENPDGSLQFVSVLVDEWKMGLKDCFGSRHVSKARFEAEMRRGSFIKGDLDECKWIIKNGLRIAKEVGTKIPKDFDELKDIIGDLDGVHVTGSLYKCFNCGKGDLPDDVVEYIKEVTHHDMASGVCGTPDETMIFFPCDECKNKSRDETEESFEIESSDEDYETRENYPVEVKESLEELSKDKYNEVLRKEGWDSWGPVACMECGNEENIAVKHFAVKGDLEPRTIEEEDMLFSAAKEFSKIPGLDRQDMGALFIGDYFVINVPSCGKCGSHQVFSDF